MMNFIVVQVRAGGPMPATMHGHETEEAAIKDAEERAMQSYGSDFYVYAAVSRVGPPRVNRVEVAKLTRTKKK